MIKHPAFWRTSTAHLKGTASDHFHLSCVCYKMAFQLKMDHLLELCPVTVGISDDVSIYIKSEKEHDKNIFNIMEVTKTNGLVFNSGKCHIKEKQKTFFRIIWDENGNHPDPKKKDNIKDKPSPSNTTRTSFLGLIQYMSPFIPKLSECTAKLRELIKRDSEWNWTITWKVIHKTEIWTQQEFMSDILWPNETTFLDMDGSQIGLCAGLIQTERPVTFAHKSFTDTEKRYANIDCEMLNIVFASEYFHICIYVIPVKPLESIQLKNISQASSRFQRMLLRIQPYQCTI